jgi:hypothetical protein
MTDLAAYLNELADMTDLIASASAGRVTYDDFSQRYGNYFWEAALDGHEPGEAHKILERTSALLPLHADVQGILDAVYSGPPEYLQPNANRISPAEAASRLRNLGTRHSIAQALEEARALSDVLRQNDAR